eukprot:scaffold604_cov384-Prasinococcus_capsulatus_cf.AAC.25
MEQDYALRFEEHYQQQSDVQHLSAKVRSMTDDMHEKAQILLEREDELERRLEDLAVKEHALLAEEQAKQLALREEVVSVEKEKVSLAQKQQALESGENELQRRINHLQTQSSKLDEARSELSAMEIRLQKRQEALEIREGVANKTLATVEVEAMRLRELRTSTASQSEGVQRQLEQLTEREEQVNSRESGAKLTLQVATQQLAQAAHKEEALQETRRQLDKDSNRLEDELQRKEAQLLRSDQELKALRAAVEEFEVMKKEEVHTPIAKLEQAKHDQEQARQDLEVRRSSVAVLKAQLQDDSAELKHSIAQPEIKKINLAQDAEPLTETSAQVDRGEARESKIHEIEQLRGSLGAQAHELSTEAATLTADMGRLPSGSSPAHGDQLRRQLQTILKQLQDAAYGQEEKLTRLESVIQGDSLGLNVFGASPAFTPVGTSQYGADTITKMRMDVKSLREELASLENEESALLAAGTEDADLPVLLQMASKQQMLRSQWEGKLQAHLSQLACLQHSNLMTSGPEAVRSSIAKLTPRSSASQPHLGPLTPPSGSVSEEIDPFLGTAPYMPRSKAERYMYQSPVFAQNGTTPVFAMKYPTPIDDSTLSLQTPRSIAPSQSKMLGGASHRTQSKWLPQQRSSERQVRAWRLDGGTPAGTDLLGQFDEGGRPSPLQELMGRGDAETLIKLVSTKLQ